MKGDETPATGLRVVSAVPGRIRLRAIDRSGRDRLRSLAEELGTWPEVTGVQTRAQSASLVVHCHREQATAVVDRLLANGVTGTLSPARRSPAYAIGATADSANRAVGRRLHGTDLRMLVPLGLGLLAVRRAMSGDHRLADAPWYVLAWYASETFWKFRGGVVAAPRQLTDSEER